MFLFSGKNAYALIHVFFFEETEFCLATVELCAFRCVASAAHFFYYQEVKTMSKQKSKKKTVLKLLLVSLLCAVLFSACNSDANTVNSSTTITSNLTEPEETDLFGEYYQEPETTTTSLSELGFYNLDEMGNILIDITGVELNCDDPYVYYEDSYSPEIIGFKDGYFYRYEIDENYNLIKRGVFGTYDIIDNDTLYRKDTGKSYMIYERYAEDDVLVFIMEEPRKRFPRIPYSMIDWDRGIQKYESSEGYEYGYKYYLK